MCRYPVFSLDHKKRFPSFKNVKSSLTLIQYKSFSLITTRDFPDARLGKQKIDHRLRPIQPLDRHVLRIRQPIHARHINIRVRARIHPRASPPSTFPDKHSHDRIVPARHRIPLLVRFPDRRRKIHQRILRHFPLVHFQKGDRRRIRRPPIRRLSDPALPDTPNPARPLRISSLPPFVNARSFPSATRTIHKLWSRTKLTHFPSGEIFGSAIDSFPETSVFAVCDFRSNHASAVHLATTAPRQSAPTDIRRSVSPEPGRLRRVLHLRRQRVIQLVRAHQQLLLARRRIHLPQFFPPPLLRVAARQIREVAQMLPVRRPRNPRRRMPQQTRRPKNSLHLNPCCSDSIILRRRHSHLPKRHRRSESHPRPTTSPPHTRSRSSLACILQNSPYLNLASLRFQNANRE